MTSGHEYSEVRWGVGDMVLASAISLGAFGVFFLAIGGASAANRWEGDLSSLAWLAAIVESVLLFSVWLIVAKKYRLSWNVVGVRLPSGGRVFLLAATTLLGSLAFTSAYGFIVSELGYDALMPEPLPIEVAGDGALMLASVLALGVWVPFVEEVFFRGFLFAGIAARYGLYVGIAASAFLFAVVHFSLATIIPIFVTGILFALVYHVTRSIWIPIAAHSAQNLLALLAAYYALPGIESRVANGLGMI